MLSVNMWRVWRSAVQNKMNKQDTPKYYFKNLDALRFLAFLSVFISHAFFLPEPTTIIGEIVKASCTLIFLGVPFFFTLSSFLITYRLLCEADQKGNISLSGFYKNRILRIWPPYFLLLLMCFGIIPAIHHFITIPAISTPPLWPFLTFTVNFYIIKFGAGFSFALTILWSISIEEQFYFFWGLAMRFLKKWLLIITVMLFAISIIFSWLWLYQWNHKAENLVIHSVYVIQNFAAGIWLALFAKRNSETFQKLKKIHFSYFLIPYLALPLATVFIQEMIILNLVKSACFGLILFHQCFHERPGFGFGKWRPANYLGKISYGLYIYHALVVIVISRMVTPENASDFERNFIFPLLMLLVTIIYSSVSYEFFEKKFLRLKSRTLT